MTGKADAVRAVSEQFKAKLIEVVDGVMAHLRDDNAKEILGPVLSPLIGRGSPKSIVTFALSADVLRMVRDIVMADGEISDEEVQECFGLLSVLAAGFAKVRKEYASFAQLTPDTARHFLTQYESDAGLFGHANESTKWAGLQVCRHVQSTCGDNGLISAFRASLVSWAEAIAASDSVSISKEKVLRTLLTLTATPVGTIVASGQAVPSEEFILTEQVASHFMRDPESVDLGLYRTVTDGAAQLLASMDTDELFLSGLTHLSATGAAALRRFNGALILDGLPSLDPTVAGMLAERDEGTLSLRGLIDIPDDVARELARCRRELRLGLPLISTPAAAGMLKANAAIAASTPYEQRGFLYLLFNQQDELYRPSLPWREGTPQQDGFHFLLVDSSEGINCSYDSIYAYVDISEYEWLAVGTLTEADGIQPRGMSLDRVVAYFPSPEFDDLPACYADTYVHKRITSGRLESVGRQLRISADSGSRLPEATSLKAVEVDLSVIEGVLDEIVALPNLESLTILTRGLSDEQCVTLAAFSGRLCIEGAYDYPGAFAELNEQGAVLLSQKTGLLIVDCSNLDEHVVSILHRNPAFRDFGSADD